jgi:phosphate transport system permease protein
MSLVAKSEYDALLKKRHRASKVFASVCRVCTWAALIILLVLLISIAVRVNHEGGISVYLDGDMPGEAKLAEVEALLLSHEHIIRVNRDTDQSGNISLYLDVGDLSEIEPPVRYEDIKCALDEQCLELEGVAMSMDSSEPVNGWDWGFLTRYPSTLYPEKAGILIGIWGSIWLVLLTAMIAIPLGVGAAVYLEEYAGSGWVTRIIKLNLANLAGVPSIVYGILGFAVLVRFFGKKLMFPGTDIQLLPLGPTILTGALTLALLILPIIIVATQEALKAVPDSIRTASVALGASKWQTIRFQILPAGLPGIATGVILALSRALGETAPIVVIGVLAFTRTTPGEIETPLDILRHPTHLADVPFDTFATLPIQVYGWASDSRPEFTAQAARGILVLLVVLLTINSVAIYIRNKYQKKLMW